MARMIKATKASGVLNCCTPFRIRKPSPFLGGDEFADYGARDRERDRDLEANEKVRHGEGIRILR